MALAPSDERLRSAAPLRPLRVVVVDDDRLQLRAIVRSGRDQPNLELTAIDNPIDALLAIGSIKPDIVVMDLYMPGLDGLEACRRIKANPDTRDIDVVIATAAMSEELERTCREAGAMFSVTKPVRLMTLLALWPRPSAANDQIVTPPIVQGPTVRT